jgi:putative toxin-antitoxin system antitoxin component (TIGR02293 family)
MGVEVLDIARILGGAKILDREINVLADLKVAIDKGLPAEAAKQTMAAVVTPSVKSQREEFMGVVFKTAARRKSFQEAKMWSERLTQAESERTERIARIFAMAVRALGDTATARAFMTQPHPRLANATPLNNLRNEVGAIEVEEMLNAVLFGLPA